MALEKPGWLQTVLSWSNIPSLSVFGVTIFPGVEIGDTVEYAFDFLLTPINWLIDQINPLWDGIASVYLWVKEISDWMWSWVEGAATWFADQIAGWWSDTWFWLKEWTISLTTTLWHVMEPIWEWYQSIDDWITDRLSGVYAYISSVTRDLVDFDFFGAAWALVKPAIDGWELVGGAVLDLVQYPVDWFTSAVLEPILGQFAGGFERDMEQSNHGEEEG